MQGRSRKETGAAPMGPLEVKLREDPQGRKFDCHLGPQLSQRTDGNAGAYRLQWWGGLPFLPPSQNELLSPLTHSLIHSFTPKSIIFTFTHSLKKNKTKLKPTGWVPKSYVRG